METRVLTSEISEDAFQVEGRLIARALRDGLSAWRVVEELGEIALEVADRDSEASDVLDVRAILKLAELLRTTGNVPLWDAAQDVVGAIGCRDDAVDLACGVFFIAHDLAASGWSQPDAMSLQVREFLCTARDVGGDELVALVRDRLEVLSQPHQRAAATAAPGEAGR